METTEKNKLSSILKKNQYFKSTFESLLLNNSLTSKQLSFLLSSALVFLNEYRRDRRKKSYADLAYYIILKYSLNTNDYKPLLDISAVLGFYPITNYILQNELIHTNFSDFALQYKLKDYENNDDGSSPYIETYEQNTSRDKLLKSESRNKAFLAPTSYGKSSLIIKYIQSNVKNKIAIIVPTKSLLIQTYKMIRSAQLNYKILFHDEMYDGSQKFIGVFTQERALRLMKKQNIYFDLLIVDEAHNILNRDNRSSLLARLIRMNQHLNQQLETIYLSPLVENADNLSVGQEITPFRINFNLKSPEIFEYNISNKLLKHNRFFINDSNRGLEIGAYNSFIELIKETKKKKNFLYNYRPIDIEHLAKRLIPISQLITNDFQIQKIVQTLKEEIHENFYITNLVQYGIIYLHGKIPDLIKEYLEYKFKSVDSIKFIVANSVILEGMNLPIDNLYIFNTRGLLYKELTNLIGRVNRLNEVFKEGNNLYKLVPPVYFVNNLEYNKHKDAAASMFNKIKLLRNRSFSDQVDNPLLKNFDINSIKHKDSTVLEEKKSKIRTLIENENLLLEKNGSEKGRLKQYFIENGFSLFYSDLDTLTELIYRNLSKDKYKNEDWHQNNLLEKVYEVFIKDFISIDKFIIDYEFYRLKEDLARRYYNIYLSNRVKPLKENIKLMHRYLLERKKSNESKKHLFYIGTSFGEIKYHSDKYFKDTSNYNVAINLKTKSSEELVNYAVIKLKIEDDFLNFKLHKFVVFLYDYSLISKDEYHNYVYGTTDEKRIALTKLGFGINIISQLGKDNQLRNLKFDSNNNIISNSEFREYLNRLNDFQRFEIDRIVN